MKKVLLVIILFFCNYGNAYSKELFGISLDKSYLKQNLNIKEEFANLYENKSIRTYGLLHKHEALNFDGVQYFIDVWNENDAVIKIIIYTSNILNPLTKDECSDQLDWYFEYINKINPKATTEKKLFLYNFRYEFYWSSGNDPKGYVLSVDCHEGNEASYYLSFQFTSPIFDIATQN